MQQKSSSKRRSRNDVDGNKSNAEEVETSHINNTHPSASSILSIWDEKEVYCRQEKKQNLDELDVTREINMVHCYLQHIVSVD